MVSPKTTQPTSWTCEPIKLIQVHRGHILAAEGSNVITWRPNEKHPDVVKVFTEGCVITSMSCFSVNDSENIDVIVSSLYFYRKFSINLTGKLQVNLGPLLEGRYGEIIAGHCLESGGFIVYDLNNVATLHETIENTGTEMVTIYQGHLGAPDCVTITGERESDILIFVATSSRVSICRLSKSDNDGHEAVNEIRIIHNFSQPKGVIFSVNFYFDSNLIITTSDDRSISLWRCKFTQTEPGVHDSLLCGDAQNRISVTLQATLEGHTSRVFNAILVDKHIVSVGEDSSIVAWSLENLSRHRVIGNHSGCTVWSCAYDPYTGSIYTGGDNGSIFIWNLSQVLHDYELTQYCELYPAWSTNGSESPTLQKAPTDYPRLVKSFDERASVVTTNSGKLLIVNDTTVLYSNEDPAWKGYLTFTWFPGNSMYVTGTLSGNVSFNQLQPTANGSQQLLTVETKTFSVPKLEKILHLHFISQSELLISTITSLLKYELVAPDTETRELIQQHVLKWSIKQKSNTNCVEAWKNVIFVGLDNGKIKAYNRSTGMKLYEFKARHDKYGVGGIIEYEGQLVTGGRDSSLNFFFIEKDFGEGESHSCSSATNDPVTHLRKVPLPFLWVGSMLKYRGDLLVCGFESADFVIYSYRREQIIGRTNCGGAHRAWDFLLSNNGTGVFSHIRVRRVYKTCFQLDHCITNCVKEGFHLEDVNSAIEIANSSETAMIIASGSEDGAVKVNTFDIGNQGNRLSFIKSNTQTVCNHTSGIKCLHYQELKPNTEGYLFSGGGKSELMITKVYLVGSRLTKYSNIRRCGFGDNLDFRVMDMKSALVPAMVATPQFPKWTLIGFIACSDGLLRIIRENGHFKFSQVYWKGTGSNYCLTTVEVLPDLKSTDFNIFCGTSNGEIIAWRMNFCSKTGDTNAKDPWLGSETITASRVFKLGTMPISASHIIQSTCQTTTTIYVGGDDGSLHCINASNFLNEDEDNKLMQLQVTNDGILGLQYCDSWRHNVAEHSGIYFVSGGRLYKSDTKLDDISSRRISIQDCKGARICKSIEFNNVHYKPIITYGKGVSVLHCN